ncbi:MAG: cytochrome-c peroxidase [Bacteroidota bacterium]
MPKRAVIAALTASVILFAAFLPQAEPTAPQTPAQLGEMLFNDKILSGDYTLSCSSCHLTQFAFADTVKFSKGVGGKLTSRNTPTVMNVLSRESFFWDGRVATLEEQALHPISNPDEMNLPVEEAVKRLNENENYRAYFTALYGQLPDKTTLGKAIAAFEKTLETASTRFDRYMNDEVMFTESEKRGQELFNNKSKCFDCHFSPDFTGDEFRNIGLFDGKQLNDSGRYKITQNPKDLGKFKVPGLRNVAITAPYMPNGMFATLREVIDYYDKPTAFVKHAQNRDELLSEPLNLTEQEKRDLEAFLLTLTDDNFIKK